MKILFAGEESQECTRAFRGLGHAAFSCDLKDCSGGHPEWHIKGDMRDEISGYPWDIVFFFPDCTYITCSAEWAYKPPPYHQKIREGTLVGGERIRARNEALQFICDILNQCESSGVRKYGFENPVGVIPKRIFRDQGKWCVSSTPILEGLEATQYIQPYQFGDDASKKTGLWLFGLPPLKPSAFIEPRVVNGKMRWANQTDMGQNKLSPSKERAMLRSKTYPGIAKAMAYQWSHYCL